MIFNKPKRIPRYEQNGVERYHIGNCYDEITQVKKEGEWKDSFNPELVIESDTINLTPLYDYEEEEEDYFMENYWKVKENER